MPDSFLKGKCVLGRLPLLGTVVGSRSCAFMLDANVYRPWYGHDHGWLVANEFAPTTDRHYTLGRIRVKPVEKNLTDKLRAWKRVSS